MFLRINSLSVRILFMDLGSKKFRKFFKEDSIILLQMFLGFVLKFMLFQLSQIEIRGLSNESAKKCKLSKIEMEFGKNLKPRSVAE